MKLKRYSTDKLRINYKGVSLFATGSLAKVITYSLVGLVILIGIVTTHRAFNNHNS